MKHAARWQIVVRDGNEVAAFIRSLRDEAFQRDQPIHRIPWLAEASALTTSPAPAQPRV